MSSSKFQVKSKVQNAVRNDMSPQLNTRKMDFYSRHAWKYTSVSERQVGDIVIGFKMC